MDFKKMKDIQAELDAYIGKSKNVEMENHKSDRITALQVEFNELLNECPFLFKYWSNKKMDRDKALEEYVDGWHFLLSIANDFDIENHKYKAPIAHDMQKLARGINVMISILNKQLYPKLVNHYLLFGEKLGFTPEDIEEAYMKKNKVNYERQNQGY